MKIKFRVIGLAALALLFWGGVAMAAGPRQATIIDIKGEAFVRQGQGDWKAAQPQMVLNQGDEMKTSSGGSAQLLLDDGKVGNVQVREKSLVKLETMQEDQATGDKSTLLNLAIGKVMIHAEKLHGNSKFEVRTPTSTTGVRGTMFEVSVD